MRVRVYDSFTSLVGRKRFMSYESRSGSTRTARDFLQYLRTYAAVITPVQQRRSLSAKDRDCRVFFYFYYFNIIIFFSLRKS
jgi:hypothetical protein